MMVANPMNADRKAKRSNIMIFRFSSIVLMVASSLVIRSSVFTAGPFLLGGEWHRHSIGHGLAPFSLRAVVSAVFPGLLVRAFSSMNPVCQLCAGLFTEGA